MSAPTVLVSGAMANKHLNGCEAWVRCAGGRTGPHKGPFVNQARENSVNRSYRHEEERWLVARAAFEDGLAFARQRGIELVFVYPRNQNSVEMNGAAAVNTSELREKGHRPARWPSVVAARTRNLARSARGSPDFQSGSSRCRAKTGQR